MAGKTGEHEPKAVKEFGHCAEGAADAGDARALVQGQRGGNVADVVSHGARRLRHAPAGIGGKGLQVAAGAFGIQYTQGQGRFPRAGYPGDPYNFPKRDVYVDIFKVVGFCATDFYLVRHAYNLLWNQYPYINPYFS